MGVVLSIVSSRDTQIVEMLQHALARAARGELRSAGLCLEDTSGQEDVCVAGGYLARPGEGANAAMRMSLKLTNMEERRHRPGRNKR